MSRRKQSRPIRVEDDADMMTNSKDLMMGKDSSATSRAAASEIEENCEKIPSRDDAVISDMTIKSEDIEDLPPGRHEAISEIQSNQNLSDKNEVNAADSNNNDGLQPTESDDEDEEDLEEGEPGSPSAPLDLSTPQAYQLKNHVMLETLQNTKVAVAQFAAATLGNNNEQEENLQDFAKLQSTLFNLHHQQIFQIQLIQQLQSQLRGSKHSEKAYSPQMSEGIEDDSYSEENFIEDKESFAVDPKLDTEIKVNAPQTDEREAKTDLGNSAVLEKKDPVARNSTTTDTTKGNAPKENLQTPYCQMSSTLASTIITNHDPSPPPDGLNSLEMLQKRAQEVLDSASQGILANNLADEIAFRKDRQDGKNRNDPFFKHRCRYCGKVFGSDSALQIHLRSHTGERPFKCNVCGSKFTTKGNLKVHYQRHTQRYPCIPIGAPPYPEHFHPNMQPFPPGIPPGNIPFPPFPPNIPNFRPPIDVLKTLPPHPHPFHQQPRDECRIQEFQDEPADLSKAKRMSPELSPNIQSIENSIPAEVKKDIEVNKVPEMENPAKITDKFPMQQKKSHRSPASRSSRNSSNASPKEPPKLLNLPHYEISDNSWESLIEIQKPSETSKLQQLVDNIENKLTDPNQCIFCQKVLSCRSALQMHYRTHTGERPFRCRVCGRAFATKGNLKAHMTIHKIKPPIRSQFKCPVCHQKFSNGPVLQEHLQTHTANSEPVDFSKDHENKDRRSSSPVDSYSTLNNFDVTMSEMSEQVSESSRYDDFDPGDEENFESESDGGIEMLDPPVDERIRQVERRNSRSPSENSEISGAAIDLTQGIQNHGKEGHEGSKLDLLPINVKPLDILRNIGIGAFECRICCKFLKSELELNDHHHHCHRNESYDSPAKEKFSEHLFRHERLENLEMRSTNSSENFPQNFSTSRESSARKSSSPNGSPKANTIEASIFGNFGSSYFSAASHMNSMDGQNHQPITVPLQSTLGEFSSQHSIAQRMSDATGSADPLANTKHYCSICRRNFSSSSALQIHMRTHTGDKPFRCNVCQKAFTTKGNLKVHMGTHMWTNGASRRGRRMSLELPPNRPLPLGPPAHDPEFLQRRPDLLYPYFPPFLNGMSHKMGEVAAMHQQQQQSPQNHFPPLPNGSFPNTKYAGLLGFGPFLPAGMPNIPGFGIPPRPEILTIDRLEKIHPNASTNRNRENNWTALNDLNFVKQETVDSDEKEQKSKTDIKVESKLNETLVA